MDINDIFTKGLDLNEALDLLWPVSIYVLGMAAYAIFVFRFYRFVAARDVFDLDLSSYEKSSHRWVRSSLQFTLYVAKYLILFPVFAFFWFAVLTLVLAFLSKEQTFADTLLIALATVSAIRVTAYYKEDLSRDLAKMLPFAVLGVFLIDASFFSVSDSLDSLKGAGDYTENILYYLLFLIGLEFVLRLLMGVIKLILNLKHRLSRSPAHPTSPDSPPQSAATATEEDSNDTSPGNGGQSSQDPTPPPDEEPSSVVKDS